MPSNAQPKPGFARPRFWRGVLEVLLVVVLAVQAARLVWIIFAPAPPPPYAAAAESFVAAADPAILTRANPFAGTSRAPGQTANVSSDGLKLFGVRTGAGGGSAIIGPPGGPQGSYAVGDEVAPGVVLSSVETDHVMLSRNGALSRLALDIQAPAVTPPPPPPPQVSQAFGGSSSLDAAALAADLGLRPNASGNGFTVVPRGGGMVEALGLRPGDVLTAVNEDPLTPQLIPELERRLTSRETASLTIQRDGQTLTIPFQPAR